MSSRHLRAAIVALVALFLVAGTAFAARPAHLPILGDPGASSAASANASAQPERSPKPKAKASEKAEIEVEGAGASPAAAQIERVVANLKAAGITVTAAEVSQMASKVGLGGAIRVFMLAHASGKTPAEILAMFQSGKGWGQIVKELKVDVGPGLGGIMGNGQGKGHGKGHGKNN